MYLTPSLVTNSLAKMALRFAYFAILFFISSSNADVDLKEHSVTFQRHDKGLDWPMPDNYNPGILMVHGRHCYDIMIETANKSGEMTKMHREHCRGLLTRILNLFDSNPTYQVDPWICETLVGEKMPAKILKQVAGKHWPNLLAPDNGISNGISYKDVEKQPMVKKPNLLAPDNGISYGIDYKDMDKQPMVKKPNLLEPDNGISYGISYKDAQKPNLFYADKTHQEAARPRYGFTRSMNPGLIKDEDENDTLVKLMADNFGELLMKNFTNPELINIAEQKYLAQWESEAATTLGAVGLYCHVKGDITAIRKAAK